jgi:serine protease Do
MQFLKMTLTMGLLIAPAFTQTRTQRVGTFTKQPVSYLGVNVLEVDSAIAKSVGLQDERGVQVTLVDPDSPASRSGLAAKDIILDYNGERVQGTAQFVRMVSETPSGRKVPLNVFRNGSTLTLTAQIATRPGQSFSLMLPGPVSAIPPVPPMPPSINFSIPDIPSGLIGWQSSSLGYMSEPVDGQLAEFFGVKEGVLVRSVVEKSPAEKAGLKAGDVIVKADGTAVKSPREITGMLRRQGEKKKLSLTVVRAHKEMTVELIAMAESKVDSLVL